MKITLILLFFFVSSCNIETSKLYIFKLNNPPTENDWKNGLPYNVSVEKGKLNQAPSSKTEKLDKETIHSSNRTCHHINSTKPVPATLVAFWTEKNLFLQIKWPDSTRDETPTVWNTNGKIWDKTKGSEDGFGIIWNTTGFNCSRTCHIADWEVNNAFLSPMYHMKTGDGERYNLLVWWAGRNKPDNSAWNIPLDSTGIHEPRPSYIEEKLPKKEERGEENCDKISSESYYQDGFWTVTLTYPLTNFKMLFEPGKSYQFQLAIFDNTYFDHSVTSEIHEAVFVGNH